MLTNDEMHTVQRINILAAADPSENGLSPGFYSTTQLSWFGTSISLAYYVSATTQIRILWILCIDWPTTLLPLRNLGSPLAPMLRRLRYMWLLNPLDARQETFRAVSRRILARPIVSLAATKFTSQSRRKAAADVVNSEIGEMTTTRPVRCQMALSNLSRLSARIMKYRLTVHLRKPLRLTTLGRT